MYGQNAYNKAGPPSLTARAGREVESPADRAEHWLNLCNFTNLQQKLQLLKNDPQWAVTYEQLQLDPQLLLKTYRLPESQLQKNWQTYAELVQRAGDPNTLLKDQVPSSELIRHVQVRVEEAIQQLQRRLDAFPPESLADEGGDKEEGNREENQRVDLRELLAYGLFNVVSAYAVYDQGIDLCSPKKHLSEDRARISPEQDLCQLMACVLYHTRDEVSTFWIAISLVEYYDMRQFYQRGLPGVTLYGEVLNAILEIHLPDLNQVLLQHEITYLDFFEGWASSHFLNQMPIDLSLETLGEFLREGWPFFFRLCLSLLRSLQSQILALARANQQKPLHLRLAPQHVTEQILAVLHFRHPRTDFKPAVASPVANQHLATDYSAMENFKNLNESANALSGPFAAENFLDIEDEQKQFDNHFAIVDSQPKKAEPTPDERSARKKHKVSKIVVNRGRFTARSMSESRQQVVGIQESADGRRGVGGLFKRFRDMIGLSKEDAKRQAEQQAEIKGIQGILSEPRDLKVDDFVSDSRETWSYLLQMVKYEWLPREKKEALCTMATQLLNGSEVRPETMAELLSEEYLRDYVIQKDQVLELLAQKQSMALRKFLDWQRRLQEKERDLMMEKARKEQQEAAQLQGDRKESGPHTSGHSAGQEISEGTQGPQRSRKASPSRDRVEARDRLKPDTPLLSCGAGQSIVQFDALNSSKNGGHGGAFGARKASYTGSVFNHPRGSVQSADAFKPPVEPNFRYSGHCGSNLGVSLNLDFASSVAGGHVTGPRQLPGTSQVMGAATGSQGVYSGAAYPVLFNEADVSMMDEMNRLLMGFGGGQTADLQDPFQRGGQRVQKSSTPTPQLPPSNFQVTDPKQQSTVSLIATKAPLPPAAQRRNSGNTAAVAQQQARQSYGGSSKFDREEQDDLIIGGGGIGPLPAKGQGRNSVNSQNLSRVSQFAHIENISKIEGKQEEVYDAFGDVSLQRCLQLGQLSFHHRNSEKYQASLQQSVIKNERPLHAQNIQEQFKLSLQKIEEGAGARREQRQLRPIDEQPANNEYTPDKVVGAQQPSQGIATAVDQAPFVRSPVSDRSKTAFGNDQFNFKDTSQITTGERKNVQAMDMREWQDAAVNIDSPADDNERPERDRTKERAIDQYVSPSSALNNQRVVATPAWKHAPTPPQQKDRKSHFDSQRRKLAAYQQQQQSLQGTDATLMIVPDKSVNMGDQALLLSPRQKQPGGSIEHLEALNRARITSPLAHKQPVPQSTPAFARPTSGVHQYPAPEHPNRSGPTPPRAPPTSSHPKIQIHCMPHTNKRTYFGGNFSSTGPQVAGPGAAGVKPLTTKAVTPMKLLLMSNGGQNFQGDGGRGDEERAVLLSPRAQQSSRGGGGADGRNGAMTRSQVVMAGKRTNNMQRQREQDEMGSAARQGRQAEREEQRNGGDRDQTPVMFNARANQPVDQYQKNMKVMAASEQQSQKREISNIVVQGCNELPADDEANKQFDSIDQVRCNQYDNLDPSKMDRSALGNSANDSKRSLKKSLSFSKNLSKSIKNLKHDDYAAILNLQGIRHEGQLGPMAKDDRPLSPMFNVALQDCSRPCVHRPELPQSPAESEGMRVDEPALAVDVVDAEHSSHLPSPIRQPELQSDSVRKLGEAAVPVLVNSQPVQRSCDAEPQQNSIMSAKQQAIKEKMQKIQEMKKQQKNKLGNNSTFGGAGDNQTRVSHADRTNVQNNSSKSLGLGLNASSSLIFGRGGCSSSKNNLNNTNQSQEGKLAFQLNQSKMTNRTNRSKNSAHSSSYGNRLKNKVLSNHLASKQASLNLEHSGSPPEQYKEKQEEEDVRFGATAGSGGALDSLAIDLDQQNEQPRKSLSAPKSDRKSFQRRLAAHDERQHDFIHNCSLEQRAGVLDGLAQQVEGLDLDREIEKEMKRLTEGDPKAPDHEEAKQADENGPDVLAAPRGSGNDMKFWFGDEQRYSGQARGSGNDPLFKNALGAQTNDVNNQSNDYAENYQQSSKKEEKNDGQPSPVYEKLSVPADATANSPKPRSLSAIDPRLKQRKVKAVQEFINNAKKNKFSEWRKLKQQNQTQSSDNQSQGQR